MKAELQFFAMPDEKSEVLAFVEDKVDTIQEMDNQRHLIIGDCKLVFTGSSIQEDMLIVGSIAINTGTVDDSCADQEKAKAVYRKIRNWFKKGYSNKLCTYSLEGDRDDGVARNHWISPAAIEWKKEDKSRLLKLYDTSPIAFDIMVVSKKIGKLVPVESKNVRGHGYAKK
jgi:hypothetical protein